jgi:hypothetical protein
MGDRVSVSFKQNVKMYNAKKQKEQEYREESPALFHHWGGTELPKVAFEWFKKVKVEAKKLGGSDPFTRLEPRNLMVQLIGTLAREKWDQYKVYPGRGIHGPKSYKDHDTWMTYSLYLGKDSQDGDNSDNGHYTIDVDDCKLYNDKGESIA